jgi:hypothetical protein
MKGLPISDSVLFRLFLTGNNRSAADQDSVFRLAVKVIAPGTAAAGYFAARQIVLGGDHLFAAIAFHIP